MIERDRYLAALRAWWWVPVLGVLATGLISYTVTSRLPRLYEARATLLVDFASVQAAPTYNDALLSQQLVKTYAQMIVQPIVLEQVGARLQLDIGADELERIVSAEPVRETQLFTVTVQARQPELARDVANAVADSFISQQALRPSHNAAGGAISVVQPARLPVQPVQPRVAVDVALAVSIGLLLLLGLVYLLAWVDDTVKSVPDAEQAVDAPVLGIIPKLSSHSSTSRTRSIEAYRLLRTALDFASAGQPLRTIAITSPGRGEGKSTVVANLANVLAQTGAHVIAVDADLRQPGLHRQFGIANERGLTNLLEDAVGAGPSPQEYIRELQRGDNLRVLTAGPSSAASTELLRSFRFNQILEQLHSECDVILLDCPPALAVADTLVIAKLADATLLVMAAMATRSAAARRASAALMRSGIRLLGVVLNRAQLEDDNAYAPPTRSPAAAPQQAGEVTGQATRRER